MEERFFLAEVSLNIHDVYLTCGLLSFAREHCLRISFTSLYRGLSVCVCVCIMFVSILNISSSTDSLSTRAVLLSR